MWLGILWGREQSMVLLRQVGTLQLQREDVGACLRHTRQTKGLSKPWMRRRGTWMQRSSYMKAQNAHTRRLSSGRIITAQQNLDVGSTPSTSTTTPYNIHALLRSFASRQKTSGSRRQSSHHGSATMTDENGAWNPLEIDWHVFNEWPEGLEREEREMKVSGRL